MLQPSVAQLQAALSFDRLVPALHDAFVAGAEVPLRHQHQIRGSMQTGTSLLMPAWGQGEFYGVKIVNIFQSNQTLQIPSLHSIYILFDANTGVPIAFLDGNEITSRRTAAAAALGVSLLANPDASRLLIVGAGRVGSLVAPAFATVREIRQVDVWDIDAEAAQRCARGLIKLGINAISVVDLETAVRSADIVSCATLAREPLIRADWLRPGSHLDLIGSFTPEMTEAEPTCFASSVWIDTEEAMAKSGDILNAIHRGQFSSDRLMGTLTTLCRKQSPGRTDAAERTVFKAVGTALEDLAAAVLAYQAITG
ncbi:ornithine cyclodeaminase family protein [Burkholderia gladioli]|uniref:ornithine cyclodeaminase family protein n=1 Tax=Burkholderia gladioli TaxID=28095 RepID=UPI00164079AE|nr:ornithine cyclodeaminase family protein [Burkholderia gladioli]